MRDIIKIHHNDYYFTDSLSISFTKVGLRPSEKKRSKYLHLKIQDGVKLNKIKHEYNEISVE